MSPLPTPSRRVLTELAEMYLPGSGALRQTSPVRHAFAALQTLLDAHGAALIEIDRIEVALTARYGYPRVTLPTEPGLPPAYAADAGTIQRHLGDRPDIRRLTASLRRRQRLFRLAAAAAGLPEAQARDRDLAGEIGVTAAGLLRAPARDLLDLIHKLAVLIALLEPGPADAAAFPGAALRVLLTDLNGFVTQDRDRV